MAESRGMSIVRSNDGSILFRVVLFDAADAKITDAVSDAVLRLWHIKSSDGSLESFKWNTDTWVDDAVENTDPTVNMDYYEVTETGPVTYDTGLWTYRQMVLTAFEVGEKYVAEVSHTDLPRPVSFEFQYGDHEGDDGRDFLCRGPELAAAVAANSITLAAAAPGTLNYYNGCFVKIIDGTGEGQTREILHYTAARIAYVKPWTAALGADSRYVILPKDHNSFVVNAGMATGGGAGYILLAAHAEALIDSTYNGMMVVITGGTGVGQSRIIDSYDATGAGSGERYATAKRSWVTNPDNTSTYVIFPLAAEDQVDLILDEQTNSHTVMGSVGRALTHGAIRSYEQGQAHAVITEFKLNAAASATADIYNGCLLVLLSGTGAGQARVIQDYSAGLVATVRAWTTAPDGSEYYVVLAGDNLTETDNVWDELNSGHVTAGTTGLHLNALGAAIATRVNNATLNALLGVPDSPSATVARVMVAGEADAGSTASILRDAARTEGDDYWNGSLLVMRTGANAGLSRWIVDFVAATDDILVLPAFPSAIAAGDDYEIISAALGDSIVADSVWDELVGGHLTPLTFGAAVGHLYIRPPELCDPAGTDATHIQFNAAASVTADLYNGMLVVIVSGTGAGQSRIIQDYTAGQIAEVRTWTTTPDLTSYYCVFAGDNLTETDNVWDEDIVAAHGNADTAGLLLRALGAEISQRVNNNTLNDLLGVPDTAATDTVCGQVWEETFAAHNNAGTMGWVMNNIVLAGFPSVADIADGVWDEDIVAAHGTADTAGLLLRCLGAGISQRALGYATLEELLGVPDVATLTIGDTIWGHDLTTWTFADAGEAGWLMSALGLSISARTNNPDLGDLLDIPDDATSYLAFPIWNEVVDAVRYNVVDSAGRRLWSLDDLTEVGGPGDLTETHDQVMKVDQAACLPDTDPSYDPDSLAGKMDTMAAILATVDRDLITSCNIQGNDLRIEVAVEQYGLIQTTPWDTCTAQIFDEAGAIVANIGSADFGAITARGFFQYTLTSHPLVAGATYQVEVTVEDTGTGTTFQNTKLIKVTNV